jgi:PAS domain S-box-containing protein
MQMHREPGAPEEKQLANGRWVLVSEQRMANGGTAGLRIDITALKEAHRSLRESQFMLNCAQRVTATGSVMRDLKTNTGKWSDELYRIFGLSPTNFDPHTKGFLERVHPSDRPHVVATIANNKKGINDGPMQFRIIRPDGETRWVYRETDLLFDEAGMPAQGLTTYRDITDKLANEARHRALEILLQDAIDSISEGFVIYDADDRLVMCNDAYRQLYPESAAMMVPGARLEDIMRTALARGRYPSARGREEEWLADQLRKHRELGEPIENQLDDGRWLLISERRTSNGGTAGLRVDITALKRVQQSLRDSQERLDRTQSIAQLGTIERDLHSQALAWSTETYHILGLKPGDIEPSAAALLARIHPGDQEMMAETLKRGMNGHSKSGLKFRIIRPDGEIRSIVSQADIVRDASGTPRFISVAMMDITEKETAARRQRELEAQLRHSEKLTALGTLAGGIAHDLNNTLVPIQALSKLVMREFPSDTQPHADLQLINQASLQARDLVRQILAFSRKQEIVKEPTNLGSIVRNVLQMLRASVPSTIELIETINDVPAIFADANQLQQVVVNLITNAAYSIGNRVGRVRVAVDIQDNASGEPMIRLDVVDTGCGMSTEIVHRMFEPFFTTKPVGEGTGLGLSVVHGIVTGHGGIIDVKSAPGEGTTFTILLPAHAQSDAAAVAQHSWTHPKVSLRSW